MLVSLMLAAALAGSSKATMPVTSFRCTLPKSANAVIRGTYSFTISNERPNKIVVTTSQGNVVLAYLDAAQWRILGCRRWKSRVRDSSLAGPWTTRHKNYAFCGSESRPNLMLTFSRVRDRRARVIGNRMLAGFGSIAVARVTVLRKGGGIWIDPTACLRITTP